MPRTPCKWEDCPQPAWGGTEYCYGHNQHLEALTRRKEERKTVGRPKKNIGKCKTTDCEREAKVKGYCKACDQRIRRQYG